MTTTRTFRRMVRRATTLAMATVVIGTGVHVATAAEPAGIELVIQPASALAPAKRLSMTSDKPIFPKQIEPFCLVLHNYGDGRSGGRVHQGVDIMGRLGQEVYAVVDGKLGGQVVDGAENSSLSGNSWRLYSSTTKTYYVFMHLSAFAEGLQNGSQVTQGQVIGYVGDTGNPGPGNYHLHYEVHPSGTSATVDPLTIITIPKGC
jgi:murein DD-endopeptidase MepM/ murein hydrolase activator NlpD